MVTGSKKARVKAPPAKRTHRPKAAQRVVPMSGGSSDPAALLFSADDVTALAAQAGVPLKTDANLEAVAAHLDNAFYMSLGVCAFDAGRSAPADLRRWFSELHGTAAALLRRLGHENPAKTLRLFQDTDASKVALQNVLSEYFKSELYQKAQILPSKFRKFYRQQNPQETLDVPQAEDSIADEPLYSLAELQTFQREAVLPLLEITPWLIALLAELGKAGAARHSENIGKATKPKEYWRDGLFCLLAGAYEAMTGNLPKVRTVGNRDGGLPVVKWFQAVFAMAAIRADSVFKLDNLVPSDAIRALSTTSAATLAGYIERGTTACRVRKARVSMESP